MKICQAKILNILCYYLLLLINVFLLHYFSLHREVKMKEENREGEEAVLPDEKLDSPYIIQEKIPTFPTLKFFYPYKFPTQKAT